MKRIGNISERIETMENYEAAWEGFSKRKRSKQPVQEFERNLEANLKELLISYKEGTWHTSHYRSRYIQEKKRRKISTLPVTDHVQQWAQCNEVEPILTGMYIRESCSCVTGRGTHDFVNLLRYKLFHLYEWCRYGCQLDIHHFFQNISHPLLKGLLTLKIKDKKLLKALFEFIDSFPEGLPLGVKISQLLANFFLAFFDHLVKRVFDIRNDPEKMGYWRSRYVSDCLVTCRTKEQAEELNKGVAYLNGKFDRYVEEGFPHYLRFADNMIFLHRDKVFLHLVIETAIMTLGRDYRLSVNKEWNIRPVTDGIDVCGYVSYPDHRRLRKRNKVTLCREVNRLERRGYSPEEIRLRCASRLGFALHANSNNLIRKLNVNMESRLGNIIKRHRHLIPFEGMRFEEKRPFAPLICKEGESEDGHRIMLTDFSIVDSRMEKESVIVESPSGEKERVDRPKKCLALRYKVIERVIQVGDTATYIFVKEKDADGNATDKDAEFYSYTGSAVMIEQAEQDFSREDLPCQTVITEYTNKLNKKFYKFT